MFEQTERNRDRNRVENKTKKSLKLMVFQIKKSFKEEEGTEKERWKTD